MKRILSILLIAVMMLALVACGNKHSQGMDGSDTSATMPAAPTDPTAQMPYHKAYDTLTDITESVAIEFASMMSSQVPDTPSITEFTTNDEFQSLVKQYGDVGRISDIECSLDENSLLHVFVSAPGIDPQCALRTGDVRYDATTKTAYIHIEYNGMPTTQYEAWSDHEAIETEAQAKYVMISAAFYKLDEYPIENVTIVLPDPTTVPDFDK